MSGADPLSGTVAGSAGPASGADPVVPGEYLLAAEPVLVDRETLELTVVNTGDRPVQVGSHYHFAAVNPALSFDRAAAHGRRLAVAAGTAVRFEPGVQRVVALTPLGGTAMVPGLRLPEASSAASFSEASFSEGDA
ncbi:MAG: urease subunit beta [Pseudonocardiales bacterium]|nr:urease subunit beta [Pseudonocardiales bacterium]